MTGGRRQALFIPGRRGALTAAAILLLAALLAGPAPAVQTGGSTSGSSAADAPSAAAARAAVTVGPEALEGALAGESYRLGPGDEIAVSIWGELPVAHSLRVTPEGKLLIPLVGEVAVNGLGLPEATEKIRTAVKKAYYNINVTVTLVGLRTFQVHVVGEVENPGTYEARAVERISSLITRAGGPTERAGTRRIEIRNADSLRTTADLIRFDRLGDLGSNPLLLDGDLVLVPLLRQRVWVYGAVERPGFLELAPGDSLDDAIELAGGLSEGAVVDSLVISSYASDGVETERRTVHVNGGNPILHDDALKIPLKSDDRVFLQRRPKFHVDYLVTVDGEVLFPGVYDIDPGRTTLSRIIDRAGGFTRFASLEEAELIRTAAEKREDKELERLLKVQPSEMSPGEYDYVRARTRQREGGMAVDFVRLFRDSDRSQDIVLEAGDIVKIPQRKNYVRVMGRVYRPGNVIYQPGADVGFYIDEAGGFTQNARKSKIWVIDGITGHWLKRGDVDELKPGDTVWVPEKPDRDWWGIARSTVTFLTGLATIYVVVDNAVNR